MHRVPEDTEWVFIRPWEMHSEKNFGGLKSHDYHVFMQQVLPLALRGLMKPGPHMAVMRMCKVFRCLCTKVYNPASFASLEADVAENMALLEIEFPPSFFDIMTHLPYHLPKELDLCRPVSARWMYPMEQYMKVLKNHVRNFARPEACMAKGYVKDECIGFVTEHLKSLSTLRDVCGMRMKNTGMQRKCCRMLGRNL